MRNSFTTGVLVHGRTIAPEVFSLVRGHKTVWTQEDIGVYTQTQINFIFSQIIASGLFYFNL